MLTKVDVASWEAFEEKLNEVRQKEVSANRTVDFLYRGLGDSEWPLATTIERAGRRGIPVAEYYELISRTLPQVETFTGTSWKIRLYPEVEELLRDYFAGQKPNFPSIEEYSYMVHLRHHGFPSPLLDWTRSPYIAAFFAFRSDIEPAAGKVSICVFSEKPRRIKVTLNSEPEIWPMGPYVKTHRRHYLQQSLYTMCVIFENQWRLAAHEDIFACNDLDQDVLWRFNIPWAERKKVLTLLDEYNLNAFSLFGSEDTLMETTARRELDQTDGGG